MDQGKLAAVAVGATLGIATVAVLKQPLWAGVLLGSGGVLATLFAINKAASA